jgi:copper oxidase (laccase) domain-containing protein
MTGLSLLAPLWRDGGRTDIRLPGDVTMAVRGIGGPEGDEARGVLFLRQVHSDLIVSDPEGGEEADGMILRRPGRPAGIRTADCLSFFIVSRDHLGAVHAGWRGLASGAVARLVSQFPGEPVAAFTGPSVCPSCYEVGAEVREAVMRACPGSVHPPGRLDILAAGCSQARNSGLDCVILSIAECSRCRADMFHSHRRSPCPGRNLVWLSDRAPGGQ